GQAAIVLPAAEGAATGRRLRPRRLAIPPARRMGRKLDEQRQGARAVAQAPAAAANGPVAGPIGEPAYCVRSGCTQLFSLAIGDGNGARLQLLGHIAHERDVEQSILQLRALDLDMLSELEAPLERARGDAAVQVLGLLPFGLLLAVNGQELLLDIDLQLVFAE